eukprot:13476-Heterococcus_DN1.PRE.3
MQSSVTVEQQCGCHSMASSSAVAWCKHCCPMRMGARAVQSLESHELQCVETSTDVHASGLTQS